MQSMYRLTPALDAVSLRLKSLTAISCTPLQETESETASGLTSVRLASGHSSRLRV